MFSYEEIRSAVVDALLGRGNFGPYGNPNQWAALMNAVTNALMPQQPRPGITITYGIQLPEVDTELARDVFWDLFRQGYITLGINDSNPGWPFFRLSHFGRKALGEGLPFKFSDTTSYISVVRKYIPGIDNLTILYLEEAVQSFYADVCFPAVLCLESLQKTCSLSFWMNWHWFPNIMRASNQFWKQELYSKR